MKALLRKYTELPNEIFVFAIIIHTLCPAPAKDYAFILILLAFSDSYLRPRSGPRNKYAAGVSYALQILWAVGFLWSLFIK